MVHAADPQICCTPGMKAVDHVNEVKALLIAGFWIGGAVDHKDWDIDAFPFLSQIGIADLLHVGIGSSPEQAFQALRGLAA